MALSPAATDPRTIQKIRNPWSWVPTLYGAEGLPYNAVLITSMFFLTAKKISNTQIAFWTSLIGLPWMLKPLWAAFLEQYRCKKHIVLAMQVGGALLFGVIAFAVSTTFWYQMILALLFILAFVGATHDIAADGVYLDSLNQKQRAAFSGIQSAAWMSGKALAVGLFVWLAGFFVSRNGLEGGWIRVFAFFGVAMAILALYHFFVLPAGRPSSVERQPGLAEIGRTYWVIVKDFFKKPHIGWMIVFIFFYRFAYAQVEKIGPLFLKANTAVGGLGLSEKEIGFIYGIVATIAMLVGSVTGGKLVEKKTLKKMLFTLAMLLNVPILLFIFLAWVVPSNRWLIGACLTAELFCMGIGMVGSIVFMMNQIAPGKYKMAHYGIATAILGAGVMIPGAFSGWMSDLLGYRWFFVYTLLAAIPSFFVALRVPFRDVSQEESELQQATSGA
jgi:PAT family beta-lactamase induction signal transducer AmpG